MAFDVTFALNTMLPSAAAAYTAMSTTDPALLKLPPTYTLAGLLQADPAKVQAEVMAATSSQQSMVHEMLADSYIFGLVAKNAAGDTAIVSFRGTQDVEDWLADFDALLAPYGWGPGFVHMGFQLVYRHVRDSLANLLTTACAGCESIWVTGHSLGSALAVLSAVDIATKIRPASTPMLYTFAGPRTGAPDFAASFNIAAPVCYRVVNRWDIVPNVPLPPAFEHVGTSEEVDGGFSLDVEYSHRLTTYAEALAKLN